MARKQQHEEHENHERWLVSYADFITLLFAFFVVMYAISSVNENKYEVLSDSLGHVFSKAPSAISNPIDKEVSARASQDNGVQPEQISGQSPPFDRDDPSQTAQQAQQLHAGVIQEMLVQELQPALDAGLIDLRVGEQGIEVEMKSSILFESGSARPSQGAIPVLKQFAAVLREFGNPLQVEGFTDNQPIATFIYPSNWELSAARAASVVHLFTQMGVDPERMVAVGHGEQRARADNGTLEGRQQNRRVVIVIKADKDIPQLSDSPHTATEEALTSVVADPGPAVMAAPGPEEIDPAL